MGVGKFSCSHIDPLDCGYRSWSLLYVHSFSLEFVDLITNK
jgi:hypothetical protein